MDDSGLSFEERNEALDKGVEYLRHVTLVILAACGAFWTATRADEAAFPWIIMVYGGAISFTPDRRRRFLSTAKRRFIRLDG
ncbi:MAG: hypothetical protein EAX81_04655 [Candidatus Thorarchaeota archaeon]|nr:hypothetical protein [Candidatus Thorarchaeota archaeon]